MKFASGFPVLTSPVTKMFTLAYGQQFPKVGKLLVYKLVNKILETVVHTQGKTTCLQDWETTYNLLQTSAFLLVEDSILEPIFSHKPGKPLLFHTYSYILIKIVRHPVMNIHLFGYKTSPQ